MSEHQPRDPLQTPAAQPAALCAPGVSRTRRTLLRAGAIGAPALIALKPAAVIATTCKLPSGFTVSGNLSRGPKNCADPGRKASVWIGSINPNPPHNYRSGATQFTVTKATLASTIFLTHGTYPDGSLDSWLRKGDSHPQGLIVAGYLEAIAYGNDSTWPKKERFVAMWNQGVIQNAYTPPSQSKPWTKDTVIGYLKYLTAQV